MEREPKKYWVAQKVHLGFPNFLANPRQGIFPAFKEFTIQVERQITHK